MHALRSLLAVLIVAALPSAAGAASPARQDFQEAIGKTPDAARGARVFVTCAGCHQQDGRGKVDGSVPVIAGQHLRVIVKQLADYRHARRWDPRMQQYADTHLLPDTQAIADVASHVADLPRRGTAGVGDGSQVAAGRDLYATRCAACHGKAGEGDAVQVTARLGGQHYAYLLRQFRDAVEGRRPNFPTDHVELFTQLDRDQLSGLADALARFQ